MDNLEINGKNIDMSSNFTFDDVKTLLNSVNIEEITTKDLFKILLVGIRYGQNEILDALYWTGKGQSIGLLLEVYRHEKLDKPIMFHVEKDSPHLKGNEGGIDLWILD